MPKKPSRSAINRRLDALCRLVFRSEREDEYGRIRCDKCGQPFPYGVIGINLAHIEGRGKKAITWEPMNWLALCNGPGTNSCHSWFDRNKVVSSRWLEAKFPEKAAWLAEEIDGVPRSAKLSDASIPDLLELEQELKERLSEKQEVGLY